MRDERPIGWRPIAQEGAPDKQIAADRAKIVRVAAGTAVVAEDEILVRADLPCVVANRSPAEVLDVRLFKAHTVHIYPPIQDRDRFTRQADHTLDEVVIRVS